MNDMERIRERLQALRSALAVVVFLTDDIDKLLALPEGACEHPADQREDASTSGTKRWVCRACGYIYEEPM